MAGGQRPTQHLVSLHCFRWLRSCVRWPIQNTAPRTPVSEQLAERSEVPRLEFVRALCFRIASVPAGSNSMRARDRGKSSEVCFRAHAMPLYCRFFSFCCLESVVSARPLAEARSCILQRTHLKVFPASGKPAGLHGSCHRVHSC